MPYMGARGYAARRNPYTRARRSRAVMFRRVYYSYLRRGFAPASALRNTRLRMRRYR